MQPPTLRSIYQLYRDIDRSNDDEPLDDPELVERSDEPPAAAEASADA